MLRQASLASCNTRCSPCRPPCWASRGRAAQTVQRAVQGMRVKGIPEPPEFYNRERELHFLTDSLKRTPTYVHILTGPSNCGKTALVRQLLKKQPQASLYVDLRQQDTTNPAAFAALLTRELQRSRVWSGIFSKNPGVEMGLFSEALGDTDAALAPLGKLQQLLEWWMTMAAKAGGAAPVLVIDEANRMTEWKDNTALQGFLQLLVRVTKQESKCHVILATSDDSVTTWSQQSTFSEQRFQVFMLGDLDEGDAQRFVYGPLLQEFGTTPDFTLPGKSWPELHAMCGGNIGTLRVAVSLAASFHNAGDDIDGAWKNAIRQLRAGGARQVARGFMPDSQPERGGHKPAWIPQQWYAVLEELRMYPDHVVPASRMAHVLRGGPRWDDVALDSLVRFHLLAVRQPSPLALDLPLEAYGTDGAQTVVVAPSAAALAYILEGSWEEDWAAFGRR